jgi:tetratricopeptide (TPR) repeat protein
MTFNTKWGWIVFGILLFSACRPAILAPPPVLEPPPAESEAPSPDAMPPEAVQDELSRRAKVAAALTDQGRQLLEAGRVDQAIRIFEQALSQSAYYGPGYYYLAESWLQKDNGTQALAFHEQAALYLSDQPVWGERLNGQQKRIEQMISRRSLP